MKAKGIYRGKPVCRHNGYILYCILNTVYLSQESDIEAGVEAANTFLGEYLSYGERKGAVSLH